MRRQPPSRQSGTDPLLHCAGNALIILYGPAEVTFTLEQLRGQWATPAMTTFLGVLGSLLCLLQWLHWRLGSSGVGAQPQPQVVATLEGGKTVAELGGAAAPESQRLLGAGSGKWVHVPSLGLLQREQDAASVFAGALLFSAVASFVGAWSVLFSKSLTYVVSYLPGSLSDWWAGGLAGLCQLCSTRCPHRLTCPTYCGAALPSPSGTRGSS